MKKLKTILCLMLMIILGGTVLYGCGGGDDPVVDEDAGATFSTITLLEAKPTITNALKIENGETDNRDIFAKLGKVKNSSTGIIVYSNGASLSSSGNMYIDTNAPYAFKADMTSNVTYDGVTQTGTGMNFYYSPADKIVYLAMKTPLGTDIEKDELEEVNSFYDIMKSNFLAGQSIDNMNSDYMFTDAFFDKCCKNEVTKISKENGFSLVLKVSYNAPLKLEQGCETDEEYEQYIRNKYGDYGQQYMEDELKAFNENKNLFVEMRLDFNSNNQIIALRAKAEGICFYDEGEKCSSSMSSIYSAYTGEITEPEWVTEYKASHSN